MNLELLLEAERRGILPADKAELLAEARRRGLVPAADGATAAPERKSIGQRIKENILGDNDPTTQNFGEKVGTALNKAGEAMTFGLIGDEASAAAAAAIPGGMGYDERLAYERGQERLLEQNNPGVALGADIGGAILGALLPGGAVGTLGKGAGLVPRIAASSAAGAGMGGTYGLMEGEGAEDRLTQGRTGAILGGAVGAAVPAIGAGVQKVADARVANRAIRDAVKSAPTTQALRAEGQAAYQAIDDAGVAVRPDVARSNLTRIARMLGDEGLDPTITPNANRVASRLNSTVPASQPRPSPLFDPREGIPAMPPAPKPVPFADLDMLRRVAGNAAGANPTNRADTRLSTMALENIDDFVRNLGPDDVTAGDLAALQEMLPKAREVWARMSRSQMIDDAIEAGSNNYLSGTASGIRNQFGRILRNPKLSRGFSDAEIKMMRRVVNGTLPEQMVNYLGSGLGMVAQTLGGAAAGMAGGIPGMLAGSAAGAASAAGTRKLAEKIVSRNAEIARAIIASGKVPQLPVASDAARKITEALMRRGTAAVPQ